MMTCSENATPEEATANMFEEFDANHDGKISLQEFINGARKNPSIVRLLQCEPNANTSWPHGEASVSPDIDPLMMHADHHGGMKHSHDRHNVDSD